MFPLTHIFFAERLFQRSNDLISLGCTFPDTTIASSLTHQDTHYMGWDLYNFISESNIDYLDFALGIITHGSDPKGVDYYGDESYLHYQKGYCFEKARSIINPAVNKCKIPQEMGWWKAHNIIEMAVEVEIFQAYPHLATSLHRAYNNNDLISEIGKLLASFFNKPEAELIESIKHFTKFVEVEWIDEKRLAEKFALQMQTKHQVNIDIKETARLIRQSRNLISGDFEMFCLHVLNSQHEQIFS